MVTTSENYLLRGKTGVIEEFRNFENRKKHLSIPQFFHAGSIMLIEPKRLGSDYKSEPAFGILKSLNISGT